jgi:hypothetical protein
MPAVPVGENLLLAILKPLDSKNERGFCIMNKIYAILVRLLFG